MKTLNKLITTTALAIGSLSVNAIELHDWQFNDIAGTTMSGAVNQGLHGTFWDGNLADSTTTGEGTMRIRRSGNLVSRRANIGDNQGSPELHMTVVIAGWNLTDPIDPEVGQPRLRFEFLSGFAEDNPTAATATVRFERFADGQVGLQAYATGTAAPGGQSSEMTPLFTSVQEQPVTIQITYNRLSHFYVVNYKVGDGDFIQLFTGTTSGVRDAESIRLAVQGDFQGDGTSFLDLDRFVVSTALPISAAEDPPEEPEPFFGILHEWRFDEAQGTALQDTVNSANPDFPWDGNLSDSSTTGAGTFRIQRDGSLTSRRSNIGSTHGSDYVYYVAEIAGWDFSSLGAEDDQPHLRFELLNGLAESGTTAVTAGMRLNRESNGSVTLQGVASGTGDPGGVESDEIAVFGSLQQEPVILITEYNRTEHWYRVWYKIGEGELTEFFHGTTSGVRDAISIRMAVRGNFAGTGDGYFDLDRIMIANDFPYEGPPASPWENIDTVGGSNFKLTANGVIMDANFPWIYHADARAWVQITWDNDGHGLYGYIPATDTWIWMRLDMGTWVYVYGEGWSHWNAL